MIAQISEFRMPRYREIPDVGLYLDQTVKYMNRYLAPLGCMEITTSMVSNYVKKGYISNPVRKQYSAEQIAYLLFIAVAKSALSMDNITRLFQMQRKTYTVQQAYDYFCDSLESTLQSVHVRADGYDGALNPADMPERMMLRATIIAVTHIHLSVKPVRRDAGAGNTAGERTSGPAGRMTYYDTIFCIHLCRLFANLGEFLFGNSIKEAIAFVQSLFSARMANVLA